LWLLLLCTGFEWPGRLAHWKYQLVHGGKSERRDAALRLAAYGPDEVREPLLTALEDDDVQVRAAAASAVARAQVSEAAPLLAAWLGERDPVLRAAAVQALGELRDPAGREALRRGLGDALPEVRKAAARALGPIADDEGLAALQHATSDADPSVREAALLALRDRADARALPALSSRLRDESPAVRAALLATLGALRDARALPSLLQAAETEHEDVELAAVLALGELGAHLDPAPPGLLAGLKKKLDSEPRVAKAALAAIGRTPSKPALDLLVNALANPELAQAAQGALLERLRRKLGTPAAEPERAQLMAALEQALGRAAGETPNVIAQLIADLAQLVPVDALQSALLAALQQGRGDPAKLTRALAATRSPEVLEPLLERLPNASDSELSVLIEYFAAGLGDGRAADPLLARLAAAQSTATRAKLIELLGWTGAKRALPALHEALAAPNARVQLASLQAIGRIADPSSAAFVRPLLNAGSPELRLAAARSYALLLAEPGLKQLLEWIDSDSAAERGPLLHCAGLALGRLHAAKALSPETEKAALKLLERWLAVPEPQLSAAALDALRRFHHPDAARAIARELISPKLSRRAAATLALIDFPGDETRRLLRFVLQRSSPRSALAALIALGEVGDQRDAAALLRLAEHAHWPLPAAASYALSRIALRGDVKKRTLERGLCELTQLDDPYARANVVGALAALGGGSCPDLDLRGWYAAGQPSVLRSAVARWLRVRAQNAGQPDAELRELLAECTADPDPLVRAACSPAAAVAGSQAIDLVAYDSDGETPLRQRLIALRFADSSALVGYTDANARIQLPDVPAGPITLEDPGE
jgi:HEAT repeat protein